MSEIRYYDPVRNWQKIKSHLDNTELNRILHEDFEKYTRGHWGQPFPDAARGRKYPFDYESCDWWCERRGRRPEYWKYVKHSACHWLVNFNLTLAKLVLPKRPWHILTSAEHSTAFDGDRILFDFNFLALGIAAPEAFQMATKGSDAEQLAPGELLETFLASDHRLS